MRPSGRSHIFVYVLFGILVAYLLINTGIISDDFDEINSLKDKDVVDILIPKGNFHFIETPVVYFTHCILYRFSRIDDLTVINIFKIFYIFLSFYLISKFFMIYLGPQNALLASFLFIFFPSHDSTVYFFMLQYLTLSFAFYLYAFYLAYNNRLTPAFLSALIASFISYGSPPLAMALFLLFVLRKEFKKGFILLIPNILYSAYYIFISKVLAIGTDKMAKVVDISSIMKQLILQIVTFVDAMVGPSMWLKLYYSFFQLSVPSIIIGLTLTIIFYRKYKEGGKRHNAKLILGLTVLTFVSFAMFAVTGRYPQIAFNLGNRVTIFGSLLFAYLIILMPLSHKMRTLVFAIIIFSILGISDHWKGWNVHQQKVIANIRDNRDLKNYKEAKLIYVSGNQYSKYGPVSHIEFLSEGFVSSPVFQLALGKKISAVPINKRLVYKDGYLIDIRYDEKEAVRSYINIYDSERDTFFKLNAENINNYIDSLPSENRHWIQMVNVPFIRDVLIRLMPRSKYVL